MRNSWLFVAVLNHTHTHTDTHTHRHTPSEFVGWSVKRKTGYFVGKKLALEVALISA